MYAIVEIAGLQYKVEKDQQLYVNRLQGDEGSEVVFDRVLLTDNGTVNVGAPVIKGTAVTAKILEHLKGDKVIVFKKKRRKGYRKKNGHRQYLTKIEVVSIGSSKGGTTKKEEQKTKAKATASKPEAKKAAPAAPKKEATPKSAPKKTSKKGDDLTLIEGIGPKSAEALVAAGIDSFEKLSKKTAEEISDVLTKASSRLAHLNPETWAKQAEMAAAGKFEELKKWQDELDGGLPK